MPNKMTHSIIIKRPLSEVYSLWANFENFPYFMSNIKSVTKIGENLSHWVMEGPMGVTLEWDAETTRAVPNKEIAWNSRRAARDNFVETSGQITFNSRGDDETEVHALVQYEPPFGAVGEAASKLLANPEKRMEQDLRNFKKFAEGRTERLTQ